MTRNDFLSKLASVLEKNQVPDAAEIVEEYEQHFAFKLADGFSEEEIAARLGDPAQLAAQYEHGSDVTPKPRNSMLTRIALGVMDVFAGLFFLLLALFGVVIAAASVAFAGLGVSLIGGMNPWSLLPSMPYWCGAILGFALVALALLSAVGCVYYWSFLIQLGRSFLRFQRNLLASASGKPVLPSLPARAKLSPRTNRHLRNVLMIALLAFAVCFVLGYLSCALSAGSFEFWHAWGWFGHPLA